MSRIVSTEVISAQGDQKIIKECHRIREEVFHIEQGFPLDTEFDDVEDIAQHFLVCMTEEDAATGAQTVKYVGTIRGTTPEVYANNRYKLSRLAVAKDYRKYRLGRVLVDSLHKWIREDAARRGSDATFVEVECHSQLPVMAFYAKFGYESEGAQFDEDGAPHQNMVLRLPMV
ncbi:acyl-CoA N-acyltransferase [Mycena rebaudengoi]|nr:acyl-CoA N-acyltransferase [Mycena rebaudengoi]